MKKIYLFIGLALSMLAGGCSKDDPIDNPVGPVDKDDVTVKVTATIAEEGLLWSEGATVAINGFESSALATGGEAAATFEIKNVSAPLKVVAPFKAYGAGDVVTVPDTQKYVADGYDANAFVMYGYAAKFVETEESEENTENKDEKTAAAEVEMHAACGIVKLPVAIAEGSAVISNISLTAANEEAVAGSWKFDFTNGAATAEKVFSTVALDCGENGVALGASAVDFRFVIPAAAYAKGVIIEAATTDGHKFVFDYTDALTVVAGAETALEPMDFKIIEKADATLNITIAEPAITWAAGDEVVVNGVLSSALADEDAGKSTASFDLKSVAYPYTVLYPSDLYTTSGRLRFYDEQRLLKNEFDREALAMVGYSFDTDVTLHNVCGLIKIPITNNYENDVVTLQKVCLTSNDGSPLAGKYNINYRNATISLVSAVDTMTLVPEEGSKGLVIPIGETVYVYAVVPEGKFPQGLTLDVYTDVANQTGIACTPAGGLNVTRGVETELETVEYTDVKIEAITTADEFAALVGAINKGRTDRFKNAAGEIVLANDIDLAGVEIPQIIGLDGAGFVDVFNGQGFALKNLAFAGGSLIKENKGTIKNVTFDGCQFDNSIIGVNAADATVSGVSMTATCDVEFAAPTGAFDFGFIVGNNAGLVEKCTNAIVYQKELASTPKASCNFGGIVGASTGLVSECSFTGTFDMYVAAPTKSQLHTFAGVVGYINGEADRVMVTGCSNSGTVKVGFKTGVMFAVGGVVGGTTSVAKATGNYGIVEKCENTGSVDMLYTDGGSGAYPVCGGVCGYIEGYIQNCVNRGAVSIECKHASNTWTCAKQGGVAGIVTAGANDCHNYGTISTKGLFAGGTEGAKFSGNTNLSCWAGVIAAAGPWDTDNDAVFENCTNNADQEYTASSITGTPQLSYGGVFGWLNGTAKKCVNNNNIVANVPCQYSNLGGIAAGGNAYIEDCDNKGNLVVNYVATTVTGKWYTRIGGIIGWGAAIANTDSKKPVPTAIDMTITNCTNSGSITVVGGDASSPNISYIGGIYATGVNPKNTGSVTATGCTNTGTITVPEGLNLKKGNISGDDNDL